MEKQKVLVTGDGVKVRLTPYLAAYGSLTGVPVVFESIEDKIQGYSVDTIVVDDFCKEGTNDQPTNPYFKKESWRKSK